MTMNGAASAAVPEIAACSADVFATLDLPPPAPVLAPVLSRGCITLITGARGLGKSWIALAMAHAAASGGTLAHWQAPRPARVVFVDAAMGQGLLQARLRILAGDAPSPNLVIASGDAQARGLPDLGSEAGLTALDRLVAGAELVVLDGLAALVRIGSGVGRRWQALADWLRGLRRRGVAVLLVEPAEPRALAALADTVLRLSRPSRYLPDDGLRVVVRVAVARGLTGLACRRCELRLSTEGGSAAWTRIDAYDQEALEAWHLHRNGCSVREIGKRMKLPSTTAWRMLQRAKALDPALRDEAAPPAADHGGTAERSAATAGTAEPASARAAETAEQPAVAAAVAAPKQRNRSRNSSTSGPSPAPSACGADALLPHERGIA